MKRTISALLVVVTILSMFCFTAQAAVSWPSINSNKILKAYTISSGNNTTVYADANFTRKTGTVYASDLLYITQIGTNSKGALYISGTYPLDRGGRKTFYAPVNIITTAYNFNGSYTTSRAQLTAYRRPGSSQTSGTVWVGDHLERKSGAVISIGHSFIISKGLLTFNLYGTLFSADCFVCDTA